jgi:hypothetical protein
MSQELDREGTFQGVIVEYWVRDTDKSKSIAVAYRARITAMYDFEKEKWDDWSEFAEHLVEGSQWVIGKEGQVHERAVKTLVEDAGWDGNFTSIIQQTWQPIPCQLVVKNEPFEGRDYFKVAFINSFDRIPGGGSVAAKADKVNELQALYGSQLKGLAGQFKRNAKPPASSKPSAPPPAKKQEPVLTNGEGGEDVPF